VNRRAASPLALAALLAALPARAADPDRLDARAAELFGALREDHTVRAARQLAPALRKELPPSRLDVAWKRLVATLGALRDWRPDPGPAPEGQRTYLLELASGRARATLSFAASGEISGLALARLQAAAPSTGAARSQEVEVGVGPLLLGATLALPAGSGRHPAALLLGPMGALDRDAAVADRRPLRDLAEQLAARGIASLRFDRRTVAWPEGPDFRLTLEKELVADATRALAQLAERPEVDPARLFVVGMGVGGTVAPEVAGRGGLGAGAVVVGAPPHAWPLALVEQARAAKGIGPGEVARLEKEGDRVMLGRLAPDELYMGYPGPYWTDLSGRDPAAWAKRINRPCLFLRGERDTLITEGDWKVFQRQLAGLPGTAVDTIAGADGQLYAADGGLAPAAAKRIADFLLAAPPAPPRD